MKKSPWFSSAPTHPKDKQQPVYHDNSACMEGDNIPENHKRSGTDNRPLCPQCGRLGDAGR
jgi:hypothetical protein